jgi:hypothetical protein
MTKILVFPLLFLWLYGICGSGWTGFFLDWRGAGLLLWSGIRHGHEESLGGEAAEREGGETLIRKRIGNWRMMVGAKERGCNETGSPAL